VEIEVILPHASAEVLHPKDMEPFLWQRLLIPKRQKKAHLLFLNQQKSYVETLVCIGISQIKKAPAQVHKPFAMTLKCVQKSRESPHKVDIPLLKEAAESFVPGIKKRDDFASAESMYSPFEKQLWVK
jgi:hypothetical protein